MTDPHTPAAVVLTDYLQRAQPSFIDGAFVAVGDQHRRIRGQHGSKADFLACLSHGSKQSQQLRRERETHDN